jgi:hypothetical protein
MCVRDGRIFRCPKVCRKGPRRSHLPLLHSLRLAVLCFRRPGICCILYVANCLAGRSLNSSKLAFDEMNRQIPYYPLHGPSSYSQHVQPPQLGPTSIPRKRQLPGAETLTPSFAAIQPKPPGLSPTPYTPIPPESTGSVRPSPGDSAGEPAKKRRGRPSNAQIEQEKAAAAAEGREWQPRPPRAPRKKKSKTTRESPLRTEVGPSEQPIPQTPEIQMVEAEEETSSGKKRRRKAREESGVVRSAPYDPIRQSPSEVVPVTGETSPAAVQQPPQGQIQFPTPSELNPEYPQSTIKPQSYSESPQNMPMEQ